jgi:hypothetical protein
VFTNVEIKIDLGRVGNSQIGIDTGTRKVVYVDKERIL